MEEEQRKRFNAAVRFWAHLYASSARKDMDHPAGPMQTTTNEVDEDDEDDDINMDDSVTVFAVPQRRAVVPSPASMAPSSSTVHLGSNTRMLIDEAVTQPLIGGSVVLPFLMEVIRGKDEHIIGDLINLCNKELDLQRDRINKDILLKQEETKCMQIDKEPQRIAAEKEPERLAVEIKMKEVEREPERLAAESQLKQEETKRLLAEKSVKQEETKRMRIEKEPERLHAEVKRLEAQRALKEQETKRLEAQLALKTWKPTDHESECNFPTNVRNEQMQPQGGCVEEQHAIDELEVDLNATREAGYNLESSNTIEPRKERQDDCINAPIDEGHISQVCPSSTSIVQSTQPEARQVREKPNMSQRTMKRHCVQTGKAAKKAQAKILLQQELSQVAAEEYKGMTSVSARVWAAKPEDIEDDQDIVYAQVYEVLYIMNENAEFLKMRDDKNLFKVRKLPAKFGDVKIVYTKVVDWIDQFIREFWLLL